MLKRGLAPFPADTTHIWSEVDHTQIPLAPHVLRERMLLDENMFLKVRLWLGCGSRCGKLTRWQQDCLNWLLKRLGFLEMTYTFYPTIEPASLADSYIPSLVRRVEAEVDAAT